MLLLLLLEQRSAGDASSSAPHPAAAGGGSAAAVAWAQAVVAQYEPLRAKLAASYRLDAPSGQWQSDASFALVASVDACHACRPSWSTSCH